MERIWNFFRGKKSVITKFEEYWKSFDTNYNALFVKASERDDKMIHQAKFREALRDVMRMIMNEDEEVKQICIEHMLTNGYFQFLVAYGNTNKPLGMYKLVTLKMSQFLDSLVDFEVICHGSLLAAINSWLSFTMNSVINLDLIEDYKIILRFLKALVRFIARGKNVHKVFTINHSTSRTTTFIPVKILCEMLRLQDKQINSDLLDVIRDYIILDIRDIQEHLGKDAGLAEELVKNLGNLFLKLPSTVKLVYDILNPNLRFSILFQVQNILPKSKYYHCNAFLDFLHYFDELCLSTSSLLFVEKLCKSFFNEFLITVLQPQLLNNKEHLAGARTALQYLTLILENVESRQLHKVIFNFIFGFPGDLDYIYRRKQIVPSVKVTLIPSSEESQTPVLPIKSSPHMLAVPDLNATNEESKFSFIQIQQGEEQANIFLGTKDYFPVIKQEIGYDKINHNLKLGNGDLHLF